MKEMLAILHVKRYLMPFSGFKLLFFPFEIRRDEQRRKKAFFGAVDKIKRKAATKDG